MIGTSSTTSPGRMSGSGPCDATGNEPSIGKIPQAPNSYPRTRIERDPAGGNGLIACLFPPVYRRWISHYARPAGAYLVHRSSSWRRSFPLARALRAPQVRSPGHSAQQSAWSRARAAANHKDTLPGRRRHRDERPAQIVQPHVLKTGPGDDFQEMASGRTVGHRRRAAVSEDPLVDAGGRSSGQEPPREDRARAPVFVLGRLTRPNSRWTSAHRIAITSLIRRPERAVTRIAATEGGHFGSASWRAFEREASSSPERIRRRGSSRARSMPRTGFVCSGRHSHRSVSVNTLDMSASTRLRWEGRSASVATALSTS